MGGRRHHAEHGLVLHHQGDVDGELAVALDELARAVERIDHPELAPGSAFAPGRLRRLLGENGYVGRERGQAFDDDSLRLQVGQRQRRIVFLVLHREAGRRRPA